MYGLGQYEWRGPHPQHDEIERLKARVAELEAANAALSLREECCNQNCNQGRNCPNRRDHE